MLIKKYCSFLVSFSLLIMLSGCGEGISGAANNSLLQVIKTTPVADAVDVDITAPIEVEFSTSLSGQVADDISKELYLTLKDQNGLPVQGLAAIADGKIYSFQPSSPLSYGTTYKVSISKNLAGSAGEKLEADYHWQFKTQGGVDTQAPSVLFRTPDVGATNVALNSSISISFDEEMDVTSLSNFKLRGNGENISCSRLVSGNAFVCKPSKELTPNTEYTIELKQLRDKAGNELPGTSWTFTTGDQRDNTAPNVSTRKPNVNAKDVYVHLPITVTFSEPMNPTTLTSAQIYLTDLKTNATVPALVTQVAPSVVEIKPSVHLHFSNDYRVTIISARDLAGVTIATTVWDFTTRIADSVAPTIEARSPDVNAKNVQLNSKIEVQFSELMNETSINSDSFRVLLGGQVISGRFSFSGEDKTKAIFSPQVSLKDEAVYTVDLSSQIVDLAGNAISISTWTFTTADVTPPTVETTSPRTGDLNQPRNVLVTVTFSEPILVATVNSATFQLRKKLTSSGFGPAVVGKYIPSIFLKDNPLAARTFTFNPDVDLDSDGVYQVDLTEGITDVNGLPLSFSSNNTDRTWSFTIGDYSSPEIVSIGLPNKDNYGHYIYTHPRRPLITVVFSEPVLVSTFGENNTKNFILENTLDSSIASLEMVSTLTGLSVTSVDVRPAVNLQDSTNYQFSVSSAIQDVTGHGLLAHTPVVVNIGDYTPPTATITGPSPVPAGTTRYPANYPLTLVYNETVVGALTKANYSLTRVDASPITTEDFVVGPGTGNTVNVTFSNLREVTYRFVANATITDSALNPLSTASNANRIEFNIGDHTRPQVVAFTLPILPGVTPTKLDSAQPTILIDFSEDLTVARREAGSDYTFVGSTGVSNVTATAVADAVNLRRVRVTPTQALVSNTNYTLTVNTIFTDNVTNPLLVDAGHPNTQTVNIGDYIRPTVVSIAMATRSGASPGTANTNPPVITIRFSELMERASTTALTSVTNTANYAFTGYGGTVTSATYSEDGSSSLVTLSLSQPMTSNTNYPLTVNPRVRDTSQNALDATNGLNTQTINVGDQTSPTVIITGPSPVPAGTTRYPANYPLTLVYNETVVGALTKANYSLTRVDASPITTEDFVVGPGTGNTVNVTFSNLREVTYRFVANATITDSALNPLSTASNANRIEFNIGDHTSPTVVNTSPPTYSGNTITKSTFDITFSEAMNAETLISPNVTLTVVGASSVDFNRSFPTATAFSLTPVPVSGWLDNTNYQVTLTSAITDANGNNLGNGNVFNFTTGNANRPTVQNVALPAVDTLHGGRTQTPTIVVTFSEAMNVTQQNGATTYFRFTDLDTGTSITNLTIAWSAHVNGQASTATITLPTQVSLSSGRRYNFVATTSLQDVGGLALAENFSTLYTVGDYTPPTIGPINIQSSIVNSNVTPNIIGPDPTFVVTFSEPMNVANIPANAFTITPLNGNAQNVTATWNSPTDTIATISFSGVSLLAKQRYSFSVNATGLTDKFGNSLGLGSVTEFEYFDASAPNVLSSPAPVFTPANNASSVATTTSLSATFTLDDNLSLVNVVSSTLNGMPLAIAPVAPSNNQPTANNSRITLSGTGYTLNPNTLYSVHVGFLPTNTSNIFPAQAYNYSWSFTTAPAAGSNDNALVVVNSGISAAGGTIPRNAVNLVNERNDNLVATGVSASQKYLVILSYTQSNSVDLNLDVAGGSGSSVGCTSNLAASHAKEFCVASANDRGELYIKVSNDGSSTVADYTIELLSFTDPATVNYTNGELALLLISNQSLTITPTQSTELQFYRVASLPTSNNIVLNEASADFDLHIFDNNGAARRCANVIGQTTMISNNRIEYCLPANAMPNGYLVVDRKAAVVGDSYALRVTPRSASYRPFNSASSSGTNTFNVTPSGSGVDNIRVTGLNTNTLYDIQIAGAGLNANKLVAFDAPWTAANRLCEALGNSPASAVSAMRCYARPHSSGDLFLDVNTTSTTAYTLTIAATAMSDIAGSFSVDANTTVNRLIRGLQANSDYFVNMTSDLTGIARSVASDMGLTTPYCASTTVSTGTTSPVFCSVSLVAAQTSVALTVINSATVAAASYVLDVANQQANPSIDVSTLPASSNGHFVTGNYLNVFSVTQANAGTNYDVTISAQNGNLNGIVMYGFDGQAQASTSPVCRADGTDITNQWTCVVPYTGAIGGSFDIVVDGRANPGLSVDVGITSP